MTATVLLDRLNGARQTAPGRWLAKCPAHDDRRPSLSIREADDGRVLLYCWSGCSTADVIDAIGATWGDLFPPKSRTDPPSRRRRERLVSPADALKVLAYEASIVALLAGDLARGEAISERDRQRLIVAAGRLAKAESLCSA
jgi:hypothetical protein